jgi:protein-tyrosine phosphatase
VQYGMNRIGERPLWYGNAGTLRDVARLYDAGIAAVVFRVPLVDGEGNEPWRLRMAVDVTASLVADCVPTLVCCSNGMSRSPAVIAAALARLDGDSADEQLKRLIAGRAADVSPGLWRDIRAAVA